MFDNPLLRDVFPENYITTTILLYLSSCAVETSTDDNTCYGIVIMYDKDLLYKVGNAMEK